MLAVYRKAHLWDAEKLVFTSGDAAPPVVSLPFGRVSLMICYDLEFPEWVRLVALGGADLLAAPVNWPAMPVPAGERPCDVVRVQANASGKGMFIGVADRCRAERGVSWVGGTVIVGPDGYPLAGPVTGDQPAVLAAPCDLVRARDKKISDHNDVLADRRAPLYRAVAGQRLLLLDLGLVPDQDAEQPPDEAHAERAHQRRHEPGRLPQQGRHGPHAAGD